MVNRTARLDSLILSLSKDERLVQYRRAAR